MPKFLGYDLTIQYKPEKENIDADALLRSCMMAWSESNNEWLKAMADGTQQDTHLAVIFNQCLQDNWQDCHYTCKLKGGSFQLQIIKEFHASKVGGHGGVTKI